MMGKVKCSACGQRVHQGKFCPVCGVAMKGMKDKDDKL